MKRKLLVLAALLSLCVLLAACKKSDDTISTPASTATSSAEPEATPEPTLPPYEATVGLSPATSATPAISCYARAL